MKRNLINTTLLLITTTLTLILLTIVFGWYTFKDKVIKTIDANTEKVVISKSLNLGDSDTNTYTINHLAFFDLDSDATFEADYLDDMAFLIQIDVTNVSSRAVTVKCDYSYTPLTETVKIKQSSDTSLNEKKKYYSYDSSNNTAILHEGDYISGLYEASTADDAIEATLSNSYVDGIVSKEAISDSFSLKNNYNSENKYTSSLELAKDKKDTFYIYVYGIQTVSTSNDDFLNKNHSFKITLSAE